jgi:hypothetical protein
MISCDFMLKFYVYIEGILGSNSRIDLPKNQ